MKRFNVIVFLLLLLPFAGVHVARAAVTCDKFEFREAAQFALNDANADELDPDGDGEACEELPSRSGQPNKGGDNDSENDQRTTSTELTSQERQYLDKLVEGLQDLGAASTRIGELFTDAREDPSLLQEDAFVVLLATQFVIVQQLAIEAQSLDPSARQAHIHDLWLAITGLTSQATKDFVVGLDSVDADAIATGSARYTYASLLVDDLSAARAAFDRNPDNPVEPKHVIGPVGDCSEFDSFGDAQEYYLAHPEEQGTIDPNFDDRACEVFFGE